MTNEELLQAINNGGGDEQTLTALWEQTAHIFFMHSDGLYRRHKDRADSCGAARDDFRQVCWFAFLDTIKAHNAKPDTELKFTAFIGFHVRRRVYELLGYRTSKRNPLNGAVSLDAPLPGNDDENITIADSIADPQAELPFETADGSDIASEVERIVSALPEKQAAAVRGRFWRDKTLAEVGAELGLTPTQIRNVYQHAIRKLRRDRRLREIHEEFYAAANLTKHTGFKFFKETGMSSVEWHLLKLEERLDRAKGGDERDGVQ
ncbi:MAG: hypothetical protein LBS17_05000 [Actinomycetes bacterium]|jgi:RNA polymerase sigma factor (sigma-70 family)|nr:hypothetical protein [Actinomycetes bacterium]